MQVTYQNPDFAYSLNSILLFQTGDETPYWSEALPRFYPQVARERLHAGTAAEKRNYLTETLSKVYEELRPELDKKMCDYQAHWERYREQIEDAFSEAFEVDTRTLFNDLTANITLNPIGPRFLTERRFDVFYKNSERGALGISLHELTHFLWFYVWHEYFGDSYEEYETPSLKWILSEMVVESVMRDERLSTINPYFPRESGGGCVYSYFLDMVVDGEPALDALDRLYRANGITGFMETAYTWCQTHERVIRAHIAEAEREA